MSPSPETFVRFNLSKNYIKLISTQQQVRLELQQYAAQEPQLPGPINGSPGDMEGLTMDSYMGLG